MPDFIWKGIKANQYLTGEVNALTRDEAVFKLKQDGVIITELVKKLHEKEKQAAESKFSFSFAKKVKPENVVVMTKKLATMLRSGLAIMPSLEMVREQTEDPVLKVAMEKIYLDVESGTGLSQAFAKHPVIFDSIYVNMVRAGESSGRLDSFLTKLVGSIKKGIKIRKSIKSAMMYPMILLSVATIVLGIMMVFVVPVFIKMFGSMGAQLPAPTMLVVNISDFIRDPMGGGLMVLLFIAGISFLKYRIRSSLEFRMKWHRVILKLPLIGEMTLKANLAQIAMVYGNLTDAGVPVIEALDITADSTKNEVLRDAIQTAKRGVFSGDPLSKIFREIPIIPNAFSQLISVGEQTGNMNEMLETISTYYEEEFDGTVEKLSQLMEPIMICFLGGVIGFILIAMYLPIFKMGQVVTG
jgi:type IV pilus assembly protein PilC